MQRTNAWSLAATILLQIALAAGCSDASGGSEPSADTDVGTDAGMCEEGERRQDGCNTCVCRNGQWACTGAACIDGYDIQPPRDGGDTVEDTSPPDAIDDTSGSDTEEDTSSPDANGACGDVGHGTPQQIASTPRSDTNLELLALSLTDQVVAPETIYERVTRDVPKIRQNYSEVSDISYFPPHDGKAINFGVEDAATRNEIQNGNYPHWDCLNEHYVKENLEHLFENTFTLKLKGIYGTTIVARDYQDLPGFEYAEPNFYGGDGPTICAKRQASTYHYVFDKASGDCPAGCINHEYWYFTVDQSGTVTQRGHYDGQGSQPDWLSICNQ